MSKENQQDKAIVEFVPFGGDSKVKLSIEIVKRLVCVKTKSGKVCSDDEAIKFMAMCQARKLNPFEGDAFLIGYDSREHPDKPSFSLITAHQAFLKRAEVNDEYDGMESGVVVEKDGKIEDIQGDFTSSGQKVVGGWARVFFKTRKHPMYKRVRLSRFQKPFGVWQDDPGGMICKCAEADALRSSFPTMLGGLYLREEKDATPAIEIVDAKVETPIAALPTSNGRNAAAAPEEQKPSPIPETAPLPPVAPSVRKKASLKPKPEPPLPDAEKPNRVEINKRLSIGNFTEDQFLAICNKNEWLGKGRVWDNLDDVPDEMLATFLDSEEWDVVWGQLQKLPKHTKD